VPPVDQNPNPPIFPVILAWIVPGLGHVLIGEKKRGIIVGVTLLSMFIAGLLIGGIDVVDRRNDFLWYCGEVLIGPLAVAVDQYHASLDTYDRPTHRYIPPSPTDNPRPYSVSLGRVNELGTLYCTLAGVLNLLAILDLIGRATGEDTAIYEDDNRPAPTLPEPPTSTAGRIVTREH
jgi:hypothetical protein